MHAVEKTLGAETLADYLGIWLEHAKARVRLKTWERYEGMISAHVIPALGHIGLAELHPTQIQRFYASLMPALSSGSVINTHANDGPKLEHLTR